MCARRRTFELQDIEPDSNTGLLRALFDRAIMLGRAEYEIGPDDFIEWTSATLRSAPSFDPTSILARVLGMLSEDFDDTRFIGRSEGCSDAVTARGGKMNMAARNSRILIRVSDRWEHAVPAPHVSPIDLTFEITARLNERGQRTAKIGVNDLRGYLHPRTLAHPECDTRACFDALVRILDKPRDLSKLEGPICIGAEPSFWLYADGTQILAARRLWPWTRLWLRARHRRTRSTHVKSEPRPG